MWRFTSSIDRVERILVPFKGYRRKRENIGAAGSRSVGVKLKSVRRFDGGGEWLLRGRGVKSAAAAAAATAAVNAGED